MYKVKISYVVEVDEDDATNIDEAREIALAQFIDDGDYVYADVEVEKE